MARMLCRDEPEDFVISTGVMCKLRDFVAEAFRCFDLDWKRHVTTDANLFRPSDISVSVGNPGKAEKMLGWRAATTMPGLVRKLVEAETARRNDLPLEK